MAVYCTSNNTIQSHITICYLYTAVFCMGLYGSVYAICQRQFLWSSPTYGTGLGPIYTVTVCMPCMVMVTIPNGHHIPQTSTNHFLSFKCLVYYLIEWNISCLCAGMGLGFYLAKLYMLGNKHHSPASWCLQIMLDHSDTLHSVKNLRLNGSACQN